MVLFKTILIILLVYYLLKILVRLLAPKILSYAAKKTESHFKQAFDTQRSSTEEKVGDVIIDKNLTKKKTIQKK